MTDSVLRSFMKAHSTDLECAVKRINGWCGPAGYRSRQLAQDKRPYGFQPGMLALEPQDEILFSRSS